MTTEQHLKEAFAVCNFLGLPPSGFYFYTEGCWSCLPMHFPNQPIIYN